MRLVELTGQRFGRLVVSRRSATTAGGILWECLCDCGNAASVRGDHLRYGRIRSCKCLNAELKKQRQTKHGDTPWKQPHAAEYRIWRHIKSRCLNPNVPAFSRYGGAGITICPEWKDDYPAFLRDMGRRPTAKHSIDRINNEKGYEPSNCRWATPEQQGRNRRCVKLTEADAALVRELAAYGVPRKQLQDRFGVSKATIGAIVRGRSWKSV